MDEKNEAKTNEEMTESGETELAQKLHIYFEQWNEKRLVENSGKF